MLSLDHLVVGSANLKCGTVLHRGITRCFNANWWDACCVPDAQTLCWVWKIGIYLEAIAPNPAVPEPSRSRWFDLDNFSGPARLSNWALRC